MTDSDERDHLGFSRCNHSQNTGVQHSYRRCKFLPFLPIGKKIGKCVFIHSPCNISRRELDSDLED